MTNQICVLCDNSNALAAGGFADYKGDAVHVECLASNALALIASETADLRSRLEASEAALAAEDRARVAALVEWNRTFDSFRASAESRLAATTGEVARLREALGEICHLARHEDSREESEIRDIARKALAPTDVVPHPPEAKPRARPFGDQLAVSQLTGANELQRLVRLRQRLVEYVADAVPPPQPTKEPSK